MIDARAINRFKQWNEQHGILPHVVECRLCMYESGGQCGYLNPVQRKFYATYGIPKINVFGTYYVVINNPDFPQSGDGLIWCFLFKAKTKENDEKD